jgi:hypothetical protein
LRYSEHFDRVTDADRGRAADQAVEALIAGDFSRLSSLAQRRKQMGLMVRDAARLRVEEARKRAYGVAPHHED